MIDEGDRRPGRRTRLVQALWDASVRGVKVKHRRYLHAPHDYERDEHDEPEVAEYVYEVTVDGTEISCFDEQRKAIEFIEKTRSA